MSLNTIADYQNLPQTKQKTAEWYSIRQQLITASKTASLLHLNSYHSYNDLLNEVPETLEEKTSRGSDLEVITPENIKYYEVLPTTWGTILEPIALKNLEENTKSEIGELGLKIHDDYSFLGASPDGIQFIDGKPRLIEVKCPMRRQITYRVPLEYWVQMQINMQVWPEIEECLYVEYKFELTTEKPKLGTSKFYGQLRPDQEVYWILHKTWTTIIKKDSNWFYKVLPQITHFHSIKYNNNSKPKGNIRKRKIVTRSHTRARQQPTHDSLLPSSKSLRSSLRSRPQRKNTKKVRDTPVVLSNENYIPPPSERASKLPNLFSINRLTNYFRDDPILDWLDLHEDEYLKDATPFLDYYNQLNIKFKLRTIEKIRKLAQENDMTYRVLNASLNNILDIPNYQELLLKLQYDCQLLDDTQEAMNRGIDIIFMGQLGIKKGEYTLWETYDMLIRKDVFRILFPDQCRTSKILSRFQNKYSKINYLPIKIKLTTLKFLIDGETLSSRHKVEMNRFGAISPTLIYDRQKNFALIPKHNNDNLIQGGIDWLNKVDKTDLKELYPNMKNTHDSQWKWAKSYLAEEKEELTQISYLNLETREELHENGITKISELTRLKASELNNLKNGSRISNFIEKGRIYLPRLRIKAPVEVYIDFESVSSLDKRPGQIFLAGLLIKYLPLKITHPNNIPLNKHTSDRLTHNQPEIEFIQYIVDQLTKEEEKELIETMLAKLSKLGPRIPVFHWSNAEPTLLKNAGYDLPDNCYWVDLYNHFVYENATIPGCYSYGLKDVAGQLAHLGKIKTEWTQGLDGNQAMVLAWLANRKANLEGTKLSDEEEMARICNYNRVDVKVMEEIRELL